MKEQLLNITVKLKISLNLNNRPACNRLEILFHKWNAGKKKASESFLSHSLMFLVVASNNFQTISHFLKQKFTLPKFCN